MADLKALCMSCRDDNKKPTMQTMTNPAVQQKNNRYSAKGTCAECDQNMFKFLSKDDAEAIHGGSDIPQAE